MKTFLINLDRSVDRLEVMKKRLADLGLRFERVSAIEGSKVSSESYHSQSPSPRYPHHLTPGEIGCFLSHKKCWEILIKSNEEWALILEDNCIFSPSAACYLYNTNWIPDDCDLINLCNRSGIYIYADKSIALDDGNTLVRVKASSPIGTYAYFISKEAARVALEKADKICEPIDNFLFGPYSEFSALIEHWRLLGTVVKRCDNTQTVITGRSNNNRSWYSLHPWRLLNKIKIKFLRSRMCALKHYSFKE